MMPIRESDTENRIEERAERWLGSVSKEQKQIILAWSQEWVNTNSSWRQYQNNTYQELTTLMAKKSDLAYCSADYHEVAFKQ